MIYPKHYFYRGGVSDKGFILTRMAHIPPSKQQEVSDKYEALYLQNGNVDVALGRKEANTYLHNEARKYQAERTPGAYNRHLEKMKGMVKQDKPQPKKPTASGVVINTELPKGMKGIQLDW
tara:strand:- start:667 stop:1029 length:363 start_codon:yes stop_codon:yes gene_type:complete